MTSLSGVVSKIAEHIADGVFGEDSEDSESGLVKDVRKNFVQLRCTNYVPFNKEKSGWNKDDCCCGRSLKHHKRNIGSLTNVQGSHTGELVKTDSTKWTKDNVVTETATCFGDVDLIRGSTSFRVRTTSKFIRFSADDTSAADAYRVMTKHWDVKAPHLIISVTGGARRFILDNKILTNFNKGLLQAARSAGAWVITNGLYKGVTRIIGESVAQSQGADDGPIVCLGIASWGVLDDVAGRMEDSTEDDGHWPYTYHVEDKNGNDKFPAPMDLNHTHYLLVDTPQQKKYGSELEWRERFEDYLFKLDNKPPGVLLVLEGGETTLCNAKSYMKQQRPVVVIKGLGGTSDLLAYAYNICSDEGLPPAFEKQMLECPHMSRYTLFDEPHEKELKAKEAVGHLKDCMKFRQLITVVDLGSRDEELGTAILNANFKAKVNDATDRSNLQLLNLALQWNRPDVARQYIFTSENMSQPKFFEDLREKGHLAKSAVLQDYPEFVELFLEAGLSVSRKLTYATLFSMYNDLFFYTNGRTTDKSQAEARLLSHVIADEGELPKSPNAVLFLLHVGEILRELIGDTSDNVYTYHGVDNDGTEQLEDKDGVVKKPRPGSSIGGPRRNPTVMPLGTKPAYNINPGRDDEISPFPERDLFLFAILLNREEMAKIFWRQGSEHLGSALVAASLLDSLAVKAEELEQAELAAAIREHGARWLDCAVELLTICFNRNRERTHTLLVQALEPWGWVTPLEIAANGNLMKFMDHSAVQSKLTNIWTGRMVEVTALWKVLAASILPIPFVAFIRFQRSVETRSQSRKKGVDNFMKNAATESTKSVVRVGLRTTRNSIGILTACRLFYSAPKAKFCTHTLSHVIFLLLYSYFLLIELKPDRGIHWQEVVLSGWIGVLILEEIRQILSNGWNFGIWWSSIWNRVDLLSLICFSTAFSLEFVLDEARFEWVRAIYGMALVCFFLRLLPLFYAHRILGPHVISIGKMLVDLWFFCGIYIIILLAFQIPFHALVYPNSILNFDLMDYLVYDSLWAVMGEYPRMDTVEGAGGNDECIAPGNYSIYTTPLDDRCPHKTVFAKAFLMVYLLLNTLLLTNLLIAMFSYTFDAVQGVSQQIWRFNMYSFVQEWYDRPTLPPPFMLFNLIVRGIRHLVSLRSTEVLTTHFRTGSGSVHPPRAAASRCNVELLLAEKSLLGSDAEPSPEECQVAETHGLDTLCAYY